MRSTAASKQSRIVRLKRRGWFAQSLAETALAIPILVLVFSGAVDFGRSWFSRIAMDSALSEGLNFAAGYPGCLAQGSAWWDGPVVQGNSNCGGVNSVQSRIKAEKIEIVTANFGTPPLTATSGSTGTSKPVSEIVPGDTIIMTVSYKVNLITPVMQALFPGGFTLTSQVQQVVHGSSVPAYSNGTTAYPNTSAVPQVTNLYQPDKTDVGAVGTQKACNQGVAYLAWTSPAGWAPVAPWFKNSIDVFAIDSGTGSTIAGTGTNSAYTN